MALIYSQPGDIVTLGTDEADRMYSVGSRAEQLDGGGGNDIIFGLGGNDRLLGRDGDDILYGDGNAPDPRMNGADALNGGDGNDLMYGGGGRDGLTGGNGDDILFGGTGNDLFIGGTGADTMHGDAGIDRFAFLNDGDHALGGTGADDFHFGWARGDVWLDDYQPGVDQLDLPTTNFTVSGDGLTLLVDRNGGPDLTIHLSSALDLGDIT